MLTEVLALDLPGSGNTADFGFLAGPGTSGRLTRVDPLVGQVAGPLDLERQAADLLEDRPDRPEVVLAYCAGATFAVHLAERAGARAVLVDPYPITTGVIHFELTKLCRTLACDPPGYDEFAAGGLGQWEMVLNKARDGLVEQYGSDETASEMVDGLLDRYRSWLRFLTACSAARPADPDQVLVIAGKPLSGLDTLLAKPAEATVRHVDAATGPLGSPQVQALLSAAIDAAAA
ncbi:alpha/beta fold hydrolase [Wenjunlia tyrosinilytica]|jgi:hypothetical protein|uniref:Uncharacterized protein n=1 Tax=Wenjunlia tyrosinilytica TaxID=1544741 RepID=A0A917ZY67_9ACTN|nr:alpha/beta fold hydrolase [Wenjunlia tyrosinilytica]GGO99416.1 hypothetical protein GCM10012280_65800 [Wenjunlia tyrosinilytica]